MKKDINFKIAMKNLGILLFSITCITVFSQLFGTNNNWVGIVTATALTMFMILEIELTLKSSLISIVLTFLCIRNYSVL